jgi:ferritin-like metal-binding protein YciE
MTIDTVRKVFEDEIKDLYDAEKQLVKALPKMAKAANSEELRSGFEEHLQQTKNHVTRLEQVFESIGVKAKSKPCEAMKGLVAEGQEAINEDATDELRDVLLIGAARRVEHYEMAAYETAVALAESLEEETAMELLNATLEEETETDDKLKSLCQEVLDSLPGEGEEGAEEEEEEPAKAAPARRKAGSAS